MAQTKYWRLRLRGRMSADQLGENLPDDAANILRVDQEENETRVYYSTVEQPGAPRLKMHAGGAEEVPLDAVTRID